MDLLHDEKLIEILLASVAIFLIGGLMPLAVGCKPFSWDIIEIDPRIKQKKIIEAQELS
jgi:hypothetical protein